MNADSDTSPVLHTVAIFTIAATAVVVARIFFQGHDLPGGGFIAGVLVAAAGATYLLAFGLRGARRIAWWRISVLGLLISVGNGCAALLAGRVYLDNVVLHLGYDWPLLGNHLPTATFFDLGVLLIVFGTLMTIFVELGLETPAAEEK
jgi:multisubunit Na+/H+ antiporter MnhB subunit